MNPVSITVDPAMVEGVITKQIEAAIIEQFGKTPNLIELVVSRALKTKVSENGSTSSYSYENKYDWIDVLCRNAIMENAKTATMEWVKSKTPEISEAVKKALDAQKSKMTKQFADNIVKSLNANFYINCTLKLEESK